jgi:hypothetical protein
MSIPFIQPALNTLRNWADFGVGSESESGSGNPFARQAKKTFAEKHPKADSPLKLTEFQRESIIRAVGLTHVGTNEFALALSRIEADTDHVQISAKIKHIVTDWRNENGDKSEEAAKRELLTGNEVLAAIDAKHAAAQQAVDEANKFEAAINSVWLAFSVLPDKAAKLNEKLARFHVEHRYLDAIEYDAAIKTLYVHQLDPAPNTSMGGNLHELFTAKSLRDFKLTILVELEAKVTAEIEELREQNRELAKRLGKPAHNI